MTRLFALGLCIAGLVVRSEDIRLAADGRTDYAVVIAADAPNDIRFAAHDLTNHLAQVTGAVFPLLTSEEADGRRRKTIEVGTPKADALVGTSRLKELTEDASVVFAAGQTLALTGRGKFGAAYAVYDFLEREVGCRWLSPWGDTVIPRRPNLTVKRPDRTIAPGLKTRWFLCLGNLTRCTRNGTLFEYRNRLNTLGFRTYPNVDLPPGCAELEAECWLSSAYCHSLFTYISPKTYFDAHPEWFTLARGEGQSGPGKRVTTRHLCFSNREMCAEFTRNFLAKLAKGDGTGVYNVSAMDVPGRLCDCEKCRAVEKKYGTSGAPLFLYLVELGKVVAAKYPEVRIATLVYRKNQTEVPPNASFPPFPDNILATFAPIDDDVSKPFSHPHNEETYEHLKRWVALVKTVWMWYYPVTFDGFSPYSCVRRCAEDVRLAVDAGLSGSGYEHRVGMDFGGRFYDLNTWVMAKMFYYPKADPMKLVREFCRGYYGAAADDIFAYISELEDLRERHPGHLTWNKSIKWYLTPANLVRWYGAFDAMEGKVKSDPRALQHVREARYGLNREILRRYRRIRESEPEFTPTPSDILCATTNAYVEACMARGFRPFGHFPNAVRDVAALVDLAEKAERKVAVPIPKELQGLPAKDILQTWDISGAMGCRRREMPDAPIGTAAWHDAESKNALKDYEIHIFDDTNKKSLAHVFIKNEDMVPDEFHLYRIGRIRLTPDTYVKVGAYWYNQVWLDDFYDPDSNDEWDVYVMMKFEGPKYFKNAKSSTNRAAYDRTVLVRSGAPVGNISGGCMSLTVGCVNCGEQMYADGKTSEETYAANWKRLFAEYPADVWFKEDTVSSRDPEVCIEGVSARLPLSDSIAKLIGACPEGTTERRYARRLVCRIAGRRIAFYGVHLVAESHISKEKGVDGRSPSQRLRQRQFTELIKDARQFDDAVFSGDFNAQEPWEYEIFKKSGYACVNCSERFGVTATLRDIPADNIIVSPGLSIETFKVVKELKLNTDHFPVVARLSIKGTREKGSR